MTAAHSRAAEHLPSFAIQHLDRSFEAQTVALLGALHVSLFGVQSPRLHSALAADAILKRIDCRVAVADDQVWGVVIAAPKSYWRSALGWHPALAVACIRARFSPVRQRDCDSHAAEESREHSRSAPAAAGPRVLAAEIGAPPRTWSDPGDAWRIVIVGTAEDARGLGIGAALYRALMRDRSLVARIAAGNEASIRLHRSVGWRLYRDGEVVLAVHLKQ